MAVYKTMDDLPTDFRNLLIRHHTPKSPLATKEKRSDLQRTYVEYFADSNPKISSPSELAKQSLGVSTTAFGLQNLIHEKMAFPPSMITYINESRIKLCVVRNRP